MNSIIDADAAKLAGLQIDLLQKVRRGQITLDHLERFVNFSPDTREAIFGSWEKRERTVPVRPTESSRKSASTAKFTLFVDLGIITVPEDYVHQSRLTTFGKQNRKKFSYYNDEITDKNFPNPTRVLSPGDQLRVRAFKQVVGSTTTPEERMAFLATQKAIHTGAQGASLVFEEMRNQLPKGKWYASFDEKDRLWVNAGYHWVPRVRCDLDGDFGFGLGGFERVWSDDFYAFFCFTEVE